MFSAVIYDAASFAKGKTPFEASPHTDESPGMILVAIPQTLFAMFSTDIYVCVCMCVCVHVYVCMYISVRICMYTQAIAQVILVAISQTLFAMCSSDMCVFVCVCMCMPM